MGKEKQRQSVYLIVKTDGKLVKVDMRKDLMETLGQFPAKDIERVYRAVPMSFQKVTTVKLLVDKPKPEAKKDGGKNNT